MNGAYKIRKDYFGNKVKLNMILSTKTGYCPENCGYCSQSIESTAPIKKYTMMTGINCLRFDKSMNLGVDTCCVL